MNNKQYFKFVGSALALVIAGVLLVAAPSHANAQVDDGYYGGNDSSGYDYSYGGSYDPSSYYSSGYDAAAYGSGYTDPSYGNTDPYASYGSAGYGNTGYGCGSCSTASSYSYPSSYPTSYQTPVYNYGCGSCSTPVYSYPTLPPVQPVQSPLNVSCYVAPLSVQIGQSVQWMATAYGGNNAYNYSWTGTDGLSGIGSTVSKTYYSGGNKNATVTVTSGGQTVSKNCDSSLTVYGNPQPTPPPYNPPPSYPPPVYNSPLQVSCSANTSNGQIGTNITWNAYVSGALGYYTYYWNGTDGLNSNSAYVYKTYNAPGLKYASVTVNSDGQTVTQACSNAVNIQQPYVQPIAQPVYVAQPIPTPIAIRPAGLDIGCYADPTTVGLNQPTSWIAEVTGGVAPYTFEWTGSDNITGTAPSIIKYYSTAGEKNAIVTVRSANGLTGIRTCSTTVKVKGAVTYAKPAAAPVKKDCGCTVTSATPASQPVQSPLVAASAFSLANIPWGWVAILVILVLFATVMYLIFNKQKI